MIITIPDHLDPDRVAELIAAHPGTLVRDGDRRVLVLPSSVRALDPRFDALELDTQVFADDRQLSHPDYRPRRIAQIGEHVLGDPEDPATMLIAGPCSVESEAQIDAAAARVAELGLRSLRGGAFKPRTSPYSFQGLGAAGLAMMRAACDAHGLAMVTEVRDATHVDAVLDTADVVQVGAKAMYDHGVLRACGQARKPVLLKRGFGSTLQELAQAAEFVLSGGNPQVMLCERGIRTFESKTRFTLDLCGVAWLKHHTNLPVVVDPSHAMGLAWGVPDLACAAMAMGVDALLIEAHPTPKTALSDAAQQLDLEQLARLTDRLSSVAGAVGRRLV